LQPWGYGLPHTIGTTLPQPHLIVPSTMPFVPVGPQPPQRNAFGCISSIIRFMAIILIFPDVSLSSR